MCFLPVPYYHRCPFEINCGLLGRLIIFIFLQTRRAEVKMTAGLVVHNVPLAFADHLGPLLKDCFGDSKTAQDYRCARTKSSCIINEALAPYFTLELVKELKNGPYTLVTDGSNDTGISQTIYLFCKTFSLCKHRTTCTLV